MIKLTLCIGLLLLTTGACTTQSMDNISKAAPSRSRKKAKANANNHKYRNNVIKSLNNASANYSEFAAQKRRIASIADIVHGDTEPANQVDFNEFWHEINNQTNPQATVIKITTNAEPELNNQPITAAPLIPTIINTVTEAATRKPRIAKPEYEFIQRHIEKKPIDVTCCRQNFIDFKTLRFHIYHNHQSAHGYSAHLKNGSTIWCAQQELAACKMILDSDPTYFRCPQCTSAFLANTICLKRHYKKCLAKDSTH